MRIANQLAKVVRLGLRARVAAAFRKIAGAVDAHTAHRKTKDFYRSTGTPWTRCLN